MTLEGKTIWLDPTESIREGGCGVVTFRILAKYWRSGPGVSGLEEIPFPAPDNPGQQVTSTFVLKDYKSPVSLTIKTIYQGEGGGRQSELFCEEQSQGNPKRIISTITRRIIRA